MQVRLSHGGEIVDSRGDRSIEDIFPDGVFALDGRGHDERGKVQNRAPVVVPCE